MERGLLALDLATNTGVAFWRPGYKVVLKTIQLPFRGDDLGPGFLKLEDVMEMALRDNQPISVVFESPILMMGRKDDNKPTTTIQTVRKLVGLVAVAELIATRHGSPVMEVSVSAWRKHFLGRTPRKDTAKTDTIAMCRLLGLDPKDDNQADAFGILDYTAQLAGMEVDWARTPLQAAAAKATA